MTTKPKAIGHGGVPPTRQRHSPRIPNFTTLWVIATAVARAVTSPDPCPHGFFFTSFLSGPRRPSWERRSPPPSLHRSALALGLADLLGHLRRLPQPLKPPIGSTSTCSLPSPGERTLLQSSIAPVLEFQRASGPFCHPSSAPCILDATSLATLAVAVLLPLSLAASCSPRRLLAHHCSLLDPGSSLIFN